VPGLLDKPTSYGHANVLPVKLLQSDGARNLLPVHPAWFPTNQCNQSCSYCSCANRDKSLAMDWDVARGVIRDLARLGCKAVSISGGGEPLCHPNIADMIAEFREWGISVGLTTNGLLLGRLDKRTLDMLTWCRISNDDARTLDADYRAILDRAVEADTDWAFSHVVGRIPNIDELLRLIDYAESRKFTHIRILGDVRFPHLIEHEGIKRAIEGRDRLVFYQDRKTFASADSCLLGYVKPVIAPDWKMYLCCNVQFQGDVPLDMKDEFCMGSALDMDAIYAGDKPLFPVKCDCCYYDSLNQSLKTITSNIKHREFV
jgi:MoaA/NifB/PqqE/SkfB family radical SAM enzyme